MNRTKGVAVMMLVGAFAAGVGTPVVYNAIAANGPRQPACPQPRSENNFRKRFAETVGLDSAQEALMNHLIDGRNRAVTDLFALPKAASDSVFAAARAKSDSILAAPRAQAKIIRDATRDKVDSLFTPEQRATIAASEAAMKQRDSVRQAQRQAEQSRCEKLQPRQQSARQSAQPTKTKSNH